MAGKTINPMLKSALEFGPIILFFIGYLRLRDQVFTIGGTDYDGFIIVTAAFVPLLALTTFILWRLTGHLSKMQLATVVLVAVFGGLSVWLNDDRFFKMKPTMNYVLFGGILGVGLLQGKSYLKFVMEEALPLQDEGWMILTRRLTAFFIGLAVLNEVIWRTHSPDTWVYFNTFGLTAAVFVFFMTQAGVFTKYGIQEDEADNA